MSQDTSLEKCPNCKAPWEAFASSCKYCGYEAKTSSSSNALTALTGKFDLIDAEALQQGLDGKDRDAYVNERRSRVIRDFPVPNSREDLQQLIYYIHPKIVDSVKQDPNVDDWRVKFSEVMSRAKNAYKNDSKTLAEFQIIEDSLVTSMGDALQIKAKRNPLFVALIVGLLILAGIAGVSTLMQKSDDKECEQKYLESAGKEKDRLEKIYLTVDQAFKSKKYDEANSFVPQLRWELDAKCKIEDNNKSKLYWEEKKKLITGQIESAISAEKAAVIKEEHKAINRARNAATEKSW